MSTVAAVQAHARPAAQAIVVRPAVAMVSVEVSLQGPTADVVAGRRSRALAVVLIRNGGTTTLATAVRVQLGLLSTANGATTVALDHARHSVRLAPGGSTAIRVPLGTPPASLSGPYQLLATVTGPAIATATAFAPATLTLVPAVVTLVPAVIVPAVQSVARGATVTLTYTLTNTGTVATPKPLLLRLIPGLSVDGFTIDSASNTPVARRVTVAAGQTVRFTISLYIPQETAARQYEPGVRGAIGQGSGTVVSVTPLFVVS